MNVKIIKGTSKAGKAYEALKITIGEYETLIFPSKAELFYIKSVLSDNAHKSFNDFDEDLGIDYEN